MFGSHRLIIGEIRIMLFRQKKSKIALLSIISLVSLLVICFVSFAVYKIKVIHIGNIYWVDCGLSSNGNNTSMIIHHWRILLKANIEAMGHYPFLYVAYFPNDNPFAEKVGRYVKIDVRNGGMEIVDGNEVALFSDKYRLHFRNHRQVRGKGNEFWQ